MFSNQQQELGESIINYTARSDKRQEKGKETCKKKRQENNQGRHHHKQQIRLQIPSRDSTTRLTLSKETEIT